MSGILVFFICLAASVAGAISGIGGGIITKPLLEATGLFSVETISFLSGCTVLCMAIVSLLRSRGNGAALHKTGSTAMALGAMVGGIGGKWLFQLFLERISDASMVGIIQNVILFLLTFGVLFTVGKVRAGHEARCKNLPLCAATGLALGLVSAFLGIGGGPINLAVLALLFSMDLKTAAKNSLYIILFSQAASLLLTLGRQEVPSFDWYYLVLMASAGVLGGLGGSFLAKRWNGRQTERFFRCLLVVILLICAWNICRYCLLS